MAKFHGHLEGVGSGSRGRGSRGSVVGLALVVRVPRPETARQTKEMLLWVLDGMTRVKAK